MLGSDPTVPGHTPQEYTAALARLDLDAVSADISALLTRSQESWPADYGNYGPLFVRLAWHCSGSYRLSDGRGGCDGGRLRFDPERSWGDNTNLDKALALLAPTKAKHGLGLSWGDLIVLAGTQAISSMGGPTLGFCAGRMDDPDGYWSAELGPSPEQERVAPCPVNGQCKEPLGSSTIGLIYVNPEGPMGRPEPEPSATQIREVFARMGMDDRETVALIGGGHAFGKAHGACPAGAGPSPKEDPVHPWPGKCGSGKGQDAYTSGLEGPWTSTPTRWSNSFFKELRAQKWQLHRGPGAKYQWRVENATGEAARIIRLTSDIALLHDPQGVYQKLVDEYAEDQAKLDEAFAHAWYKLTARDMGPATRCFGKNVPPPQAWQHPLPSPPQQLANFTLVAAELRQMLHSSSPQLPADRFAGEPYYGGLLVRLAWQCARTFRVTDYQGGCNGARIRFPPQRTWPVNAALDRALRLLEPIKLRFGAGLSWADLVVLAGTVALEEAGGRRVPFCGGRTDAEDGSGSEHLEPRVSGATNSSADMKSAFELLGLSAREMAVLNGGGHSLGKMHRDRSGFEGSWTPDPTRLTNSFFRTLLAEEWEEVSVPQTGARQYRARGKDLSMLRSDLVFRTDPELRELSKAYAADNDLFLDDFARAWTKLVNADRFAGPGENVCG